MGVKLTKKAVVSLTKQAPATKNYVVGLGWDPVDKSKDTVTVTRRKRSLVGLLFGATETVIQPASKMIDIDCDAAVLLEDSRSGSRNELIYFNHKTSFDGSVIHLGDNLTGRTNDSLVKGNTGDKEQIEIYTDKLNSCFDTIWVGVNIYNGMSRNQHFGNICNSFIRIMDQITGEELCRFDLDGSYSNKTGVIMGKIYKENGDWKFVALGDGFRVTDLNDLFMHRKDL